MIALIGLGNPGDKYTLTRHNIGYLAIDNILESLSNTKISSKKFVLIYAISTYNNILFISSSSNIQDGVQRTNVFCF